MATYPATAQAIAACADKLKQGALLALPTETVYGLAGDATNGEPLPHLCDQSAATIQSTHLPCR